jgi:3-dehydroquinate synthase
MTSSAGLFDRIARERTAIFAKDARVLMAVITESCRIKAAVVSSDEREAGPRRILNFGHTAGHALEAVTKYRRYRHGEAIAYGMLAAADLAVGRGALAERERQALAQLIAQLGPLPPIADLSVSEILDAVRRDKKVINGRLHFVIAIEIGATITIEDVTEAEIVAVLRRLGVKG